mgnify:CR=1 FL=1
MIRILAKLDAKGLVRCSISGHSGYAERGQDIVCAAVSTAFTGAMNCLDDPQDCYRICVSSGEGEVAVLKDISQHDRIVLEVMIRELGYLSETYPEFIQYREEK